MKVFVCLVSSCEICALTRVLYGSFSIIVDLILLLLLLSFCYLFAVSVFFFSFFIFGGMWVIWIAVLKRCKFERRIWSTIKRFIIVALFPQILVCFSNYFCRTPPASLLISCIRIFYCRNWDWKSTWVTFLPLNRILLIVLFLMLQIHDFWTGWSAMQ